MGLKGWRRWLPRLIGLALTAQLAFGCRGTTPAPPRATPLAGATTSCAQTPAPTPAATSTQTPSPVAPAPSTATAPPAATPTGESLNAAFQTLSSLKRVDGYPLYTMRYYGAYGSAASSTDLHRSVGTMASQPRWGCSLFAALGDLDAAVYGRNFDWRFSPALLLFTDPPDGYASVSMVDLAYLVAESDVRALTDLPLDERSALLEAPFWPFDGMNEHGLVVGMAAVSGSAMPYHPDRETIDSLGVIREMLDRARDVEEAVAILKSYNIEWDGGPALHYLIADASGDSVLVEFYAGETVLIPGPGGNPWHLTTNHLRTLVDDGDPSGCWRYDTIGGRLATSAGRLTVAEAMDLLDDVSQDNTQWSVVYDLASRGVHLAMGRAYENVYDFELGAGDG